MASPASEGTAVKAFSSSTGLITATFASEGPATRAVREFRAA